MSFWIISVPQEGEGKKKQEDKTRQKLIDATRDLVDCAEPFKIPALKVGTLDSLMNLSDKLAKVDTIVEGVTKKIERAFNDISKSKPEEPELEKKKSQKEKKESNKPAGSAKAVDKKESKNKEGKVEVRELRVEQKLPAEYLTKFPWHVQRLNNNRPLQQLTDYILKTSAEADEQLKKLLTDFNEVKVNLSAIERRETGTLLVKPLGSYINEKTNKDLIKDGEYITTLLLVIPTNKIQEFMDEYELLEQRAAEKEAQEKVRREEQAKAAAEAKRARKAAKGDNKEEEDEKLTKVKEKKEEKYEVSPLLEKSKSSKVQCSSIVPRSAVHIVTEGEFSLYRILVLKKGAEHIRNLCREKRYTVRPFKYDPEEDQRAEGERERLTASRYRQWKFLYQWCITTYEESFLFWVHIKAIRIYVESVLRYGLPADICATVLEPKKGKETKLRLVLKDLYSNLPNAELAAELDAGETDISGFGADFYPYVYFSLKISDLVGLK